MADWAPGSPLSRQLRDDVQAATSIFGPDGLAPDPVHFAQLKSEATDRYLAAKKVRGSAKEEEAYVWTGDMWQSARDGIKAHDRQCESTSLSPSPEA